MSDNNGNLHDYDPSKLIEFFEKVKLPSGAEISTDPEEIKLELYKRTKKHLKDAKDLKDEFIDYLIAKFNSSPIDNLPLHPKTLDVMEEGSNIMLKFIDGIWSLMWKRDPVIMASITDIGMSIEDVKRFKIFFKMCLGIVERDRENFRKKRGY